MKDGCCSAMFLGGCSTCVNILKVFSPTKKNFIILVSLVCNNFPPRLASCLCELLWAESLKGGCSCVESVWCSFWWFSCFYSRPKRSPDTGLWIYEVCLHFALLYIHIKCMHMCTHIYMYAAIWFYNQVRVFFPDLYTFFFHCLMELTS